jgi:hypothetical protein
LGWASVTRLMGSRSGPEAETPQHSANLTRQYRLPSKIAKLRQCMFLFGRLLHSSHNTDYGPCGIAVRSNIRASSCFYVDKSASGGTPEYFWIITLDFWTESATRLCGGIECRPQQGVRERNGKYSVNGILSDIPSSGIFRVVGSSRFLKPMKSRGRSC